MNKIMRSLLLILVFWVSGCSSMNSHFSCNLTAGDSCLSMDEVNAMTEGKAVHLLEKQYKRPIVMQKTRVRRVWVAPFADKGGIKHPSERVYVPELLNEEQA